MPKKISDAAGTKKKPGEEPDEKPDVVDKPRQVGDDAEIDDHVEIDIPAEEPLADDDGPTDDGEPRLTRDEKKRARGRVIEENERLRTEAASERAAREALERTVVDRFHHDAYRPAAPTASAEDPEITKTKTALNGVYDRIERISLTLQQAGAKMTPEQLASVRTEIRDLDIEKGRLQRKLDAAAEPRPRQVDATQIAREVQFNALREDYAEASEKSARGQRLALLVQARYATILANEPGDSFAKLRRAHKEVFVEEGIHRSESGAGGRDKYIGTGKGSGAGGSNGNRPQGLKLKGISVKEAQQLADGKYDKHARAKDPALRDSKVRLTRWLKTTGAAVAKESS